MTILDLKEIFEREFQQYRETLLEISRESRKGSSLIEDEENLYYNFDKIKNENIYKNAPVMPASADTIIFKDDEIVFVEFKNGRIENVKKKKKEIKLKAIEGCFIVLDRIVKKYNNSFLDVVKLNKSYILVYNNEKNPMNEIFNRSDFAELEAALKIYEGNFFYNISVMPADLFEKEYLLSESIQSDIINNGKP